MAVVAKDMHNLYSTRILNYYRTEYAEAYFTTTDGKRIRCTREDQESGDHALVILGGRTEYLEKYLELFFDLRESPLVIFSYDHRGQGLSERLLENRQEGHVDSFDDYVSDLHFFLQHVVTSRYSTLSILAHSMGGAIALRHEQIHGGLVDNLVLSSPMLSIRTFPLPNVVARAIAGTATLFGLADRGVAGGDIFTKEPEFKDNTLTSSRERYFHNLAVQRQFPELTIGNPTYGWLHQAFTATRAILSSAEQCSLPVLLLQAGNDKIVEPWAQDMFCRRAKQCSIVVMDDARHEILMERDSIRNRALAEIKAFLLRNAGE